MRYLLSGNDFCGSPEGMGCHAHRGVRLILSTHNMTSPVDQGGDSTGRRIRLSIKPQGMLNTHRMMKQLWSPTHDDKAQKRKAQFDVDNWDERSSKMQCLAASAKELLKEDHLQKRRMVFEDDSKDELEVKRLCLPPRV